MNHELLVPAGNMECLHQAVYNGADAVYVSGINFGARKFAANFTIDELVQAINFCHLYGVRIYVTMNTLIKNNEVNDFLEQARFLHKNGVDALIVQDFGMICLLRKKFPNLEIHASTQANISSKDICKIYYDLGVKRVVFSRELTLEEIDDIDVPIEKEAFIHGALCVSYSGCCLMSSMLGGRSGNRGECAGTCRMPFVLVKDGNIISKNKYLLSMKELNTSTEIDKLLSSSIYSFKIEGRMKSPLYVGFITRFYRRLIDGEKIDFVQETNNLKTIFNRDFTTGHMFNNNGIKLINSKSPNHIGLEIGKASVYKDKIKLDLNNGMKIDQFDAIRFLNSKKGMTINFLYDKNMKLCNSSNDICYVDNKVGLEKDDILTKTQSYELEELYKDSSDRRKIKVSFDVVAKVDNELIIKISDGENEIIRKGNVVQKSINAPTDEYTFRKQLSKLGDTIYIIDQINYDIDDNIFVQIKTINDLRRELTSELTKTRMNNKTEFIEKDFKFERNIGSNTSKMISCSVFNKEQLNVCFKYNVDRIYIKNKELYEEYKDRENVYLFLDRCCYSYDNNNCITSDIYYFKDNVFGNYSLNITNIYSAYFLSKLGLKNTPLSVELNESEINEFITLYNDNIGSLESELLSYGRVENMIIKSNILDIEENKYDYYLKDLKDRVFPVYFDGINTHIYNHENRDLVNENVSCLRIDFYDEDNSQVEAILKKYIFKK